MDTQHMTKADAQAKTRTRTVMGKSGLVFATLFGVVVPVITLGLEMFTRLSSENYVDPVPTFLHVILVASVPVINLLLIGAITGRKFEFARALGWLNGLAIGVAVLYALVYIPLTPIAFIAIIFYGIGLLPLSPLFSAIAAISLRLGYRHLLSRPLPGLWRGIALAVLLMVVAEAPKAITLTGMHMSQSESALTRVRGLHLLRSYGNQDVLLRACYLRGSRVPDITGFLLAAVSDPISSKDARELFYRVTGKPFNSVKPPKSLHSRRASLWSEFDFEQGGESVESRVRDLSLHESRFDASIDATAALSYTEWTLVFKNDAISQHEARALVALPPGGVVSRLTLWIDGEPREAAFGTRSQVREAYQRVVRRRRDPVLVTTSGPDQVLVQCFPVPAGGGLMKIRVGITAPLALRTEKEGGLRLPYFVERNFSVPVEFEHSLWIESRQALRPGKAKPTLIHEKQRELHALRGALNDAELSEVFVVWADRDESMQSWAPDPKGGEHAVVVQNITQQTLLGPSRLVVVIDGSRRMQSHVEGISAALERIPVDTEYGILIAGDTVEVVTPVRKAAAEALRESVRAVREHEYAGGCDNVPALVSAWDWASSNPDSVILWLHATQPVELQRIESLLQKWERRPGGPKLYDLQFGSGPNRVTPRLEGVAPVIRVPRLGAPESDLTRLFSQWRGDSKSWSFERTRLLDSSIGETVHQTSDHLVRLWANAEVARLAASGASGRPEAITLATTYQLVTPVSGAVVLETQQQYDQAGLEPVSQNSVPTVPEPETWIMMIVVGLILMFLSAREYRERKRNRVYPSVGQVA